MSTLGHRCVCSGTVSPGSTRVWITLTRIIFHQQLVVLGAATSASSESGHGQSLVIIAELTSPPPCRIINSAILGYQSSMIQSSIVNSDFVI
jgi:hypothetical protein